MTKKNGEGNNEEILLITDEEIQAAINKLKKGIANDSNGIRAEDIKTCDNETKEVIKLIFNEVLKQESCTPEVWRRKRIKSFPRKRERRRRPEQSPNLYFASAVQTVFRLFCTTDFVPGSYHAIDHLATYRMIEQKCHEWGLQMWIATIDFMKAFDHPSQLYRGLPQNLWYRT